MNRTDHSLYYLLLILLTFLFIKCGQNTPLKVTLYDNKIFNNQEVNKIDKKDSIILVSTFDSLNTLLKNNEISFYTFNLAQKSSLLFSYVKNEKSQSLYLPKPIINEIFLLQHAATKDPDGLFVPIEKHGNKKESLITLFEQNNSEGYQYFENIFSYNNRFLKDSLQLKNTTIEETKDNHQFIKTDHNDLIKLLGLTCNGIICGLANLNQAFILKYGYEKKMPVGNWFIQNYAGVKLYWSTINAKENRILIVLVPELNNGILVCEPRKSSHNYGIQQESDITYHPFIAQWMIGMLKSRFKRDSDRSADAVRSNARTSFITCQSSNNLTTLDFENTLEERPKVPLLSGEGFRVRSKIPLVESRVRVFISDLETKAMVGIARIQNNNKGELTDNLKSFYNIQLPLACINYVPDNYYGKREFSLEKETKIRIKAIGEGNTIKDNDRDIDREHIEFMFDMANKKSGPMEGNENDRQFRISFVDSAIFGIYRTRKGIVYRHFFEDTHHYNLEVYFPWDVLGYVKPKDGVRFGFDISISDNDGGGREKKICWYGKNDRAFYNTAFLGNIALSNNTGSNEKGPFVTAGYTSHKPRIDGKEDECWERAALYNIDHVVLGTLDNKNDIKGAFKALWDAKGLYVLVKVTDDDINYNSQVKSYCKDYGWIEDMTSHDKVWCMKKTHCHSIGKENINVYCDTTIILPKGKYNLVYVSDDSHAYMNWFDQSEYLPFYGIKIFKE